MINEIDTLVKRYVLWADEVIMKSSDELGDVLTVARFIAGHQLKGKLKKYIKQD